MHSAPRRPGVLFLDVLIGSAVFAIVVSGVIYAMLFSQQGMLRSGDRIRAIFLNHQAIAAVRAVRDGDFADLEEGTFGAIINEAGIWELTGTGVTTQDGYTTSVTVESISSDRYRATATTTWGFQVGSSGEVTLSTEITDWHRTMTVGNWGGIALDGAYVDDDTPLFNAAAIGDTYAFVTSETSDGGAGLYVFDISDTSSPSRVSSAFHLGVPGYQAELVGTNLFVATGDAAAEVHVYDVTDPGSLDSGDLITSINIPGSANVRSIVYYNDTLYVAANEDSGESEFFTYDVSDLGSVTLLDELNDPGSSLRDINLLNGYAYLASSMDTMELRVIDIFDASDISVAPGGGYNVTDTPDGTAVIAVGDHIILGRNQGDVTEELHLFDVSESPVPPSAPYNAETGEDVNALAADPTGTYGFAATNHDSQELIVLDIDTFASGGNPIDAVYNTSTGFGRGVTYSIYHDRVFLMTNTAFIVLRPS